MNRLFVSGISSVGLVARGDDPLATIEIFKSHPEPISELEKSRRSLAEHDQWKRQQREILKRDEERNMAAQEDTLKRRDQWVEEHRNSGETVFQARQRFWKANPDAKRQSRSPVGKTSESNFGEKVSAAIERRARQYHVDDPRTLDKSIPELKVHIRKSLPALKRLERNQEPVDIAKSAYSKSVDPQVRAALEFVKTWSE